MARLGESSVQRLGVCREVRHMGTASRLRRRVAALGPRDAVPVFRMRCAAGSMAVEIDDVAFPDDQHFVSLW